MEINSDNRLPINLADEKETIDYVLVYNDDELTKRDFKKDKDTSRLKVANYLS